MNPRIGLSHSCQSDGQKRTGTNTASPSIVLAPESALGSHPCVAPPSAQAETSIRRQMLIDKSVTTQCLCRGVDKSS